ncbi:hypothetical protein LTR39_003516, partial [Cryomyces antarcticus]
DVSLDSQRCQNELVEAFRSQVDRLFKNTERNLFKRWNPMRPIMLWYNTRRMDSFLGRVLDERFSSREVPKAMKEKHIIDLALETYHGHQQQDNLVESKKPQTMDANFKRRAINHIKTFIFAGHNTTSSVICYVYHLLSKHPTASPLFARSTTTSLVQTCL